MNWTPKCKHRDQVCLNRTDRCMFSVDCTRVKLISEVFFFVWFDYLSQYLMAQ